MGHEKVDPSQFIQELLESARKEEWEKVDKELVPQLKNFNGDIVAEKLLKYVSDTDPNVRDIVATSFAGLEVLNPKIESQIAESMFRMASEDIERYPVGRAMAYLLVLREKPGFKVRVESALADFRERVKENAWTDDLRAAIPALSEVL